MFRPGAETYPLPFRKPGGRGLKPAHDIILKPVITENSMAGIADKKYTFKVATDATKIDIANAVEAVRGVFPLLLRQGCTAAGVNGQAGVLGSGNIKLRKAEYPF